MIRQTELNKNREKGLVPGLPLVIHTTKTPECGLLRLKIDTTDLRSLYGLDIVIAHDGTRTEKVLALADAIVRAQPGELELWNVGTGQFVSIVSMGKKYISIVPPRGDIR
jgi:hypothetical protein